VCVRERETARKRQFALSFARSLAFSSGGHLVGGSSQARATYRVTSAPTDKVFCCVIVPHFVNETYQFWSVSFVKEPSKNLGAFVFNETEEFRELT